LNTLPNQDNRNGNSKSYEAFVQLLARYERGLRAFVYTLLAEPQHADEVIQETCLVLWRKFGDFEPNTEFLTWACTIARFEVLKYRRKLARDRHVFHPELLALLADEALTETPRLAKERQALDLCLEKLAPRQRELVQSCYAEGVTIKQVAEKLGKSATALYKVLNRIRLLLLDCIEVTIAREER
jgi:RNA polymerase sigma-70 factor (ECF subfamily)